MNTKTPLETSRSSLPATPYYLLDEAAIVANMKIIARLCELSGAKALLALKCFATWGVFDVMQPYLHGTTSSSLNEVRLGYETFGKDKDSDISKDEFGFVKIDKALITCNQYSSEDLAEDVVLLASNGIDLNSTDNL